MPWLSTAFINDIMAVFRLTSSLYRPVLRSRSLMRVWEMTGQTAINIFTVTKLSTDIQNHVLPSIHLESCPLTGKALVVQHGLQNLPVPTRHQANGTHDLQHRHLGLDVLCGQALSDDVDALWMREDVGTALRVVHQSFDAADQGRVDLWFGGLIVHGLQEVQDARQAIQVDETSHEPVMKSSQRQRSLGRGVCFSSFILLIQYKHVYVRNPSHCYLWRAESCRDFCSCWNLVGHISIGCNKMKIGCG